MVHFWFFEYIKKVAARNRCEPVPTLRTDDYDDDYYDVSRLGHDDNAGNSNKEPCYVDLKLRKVRSSFSGLRKSAMDIHSSKVDWSKILRISLQQLPNSS